MNAYELIETKPHFHVFRDGTPRLMSLLDNALKWMADELSSRKDAATLETGYGLTTVLMTMLANKHCSIAPDEPGYKRILDYCKEKGISSTGLTYCVGCSEDILPSLKIEDESLDMVLIDGSHGFPAPFVDYAYTFKKIQLGGYLVVDDIQLATGFILKDFLLQSKEWELTGFFDGKTCVFRKHLHTDREDWTRQPFMTQMHEQVKAMLSRTANRGIENLCVGPILTPVKWTERQVQDPAVMESALLPFAVVERMQLLRFKDKVAKVALFGAGKHSEWLEKILAGKKGVPKVVAVLDDSPEGKPARFGLKPVMARSFRPKRVDAIVLSSDCSQHSMRERCIRLYGNAVKLVDLYEGLPKGPYQK